MADRAGAQTTLVAVGQALNAFYRFTRPHTMLGTAVSVCSVSALAAGGAFNPAALAALAQALSAALLANISIVGINQVGTGCSVPRLGGC